jgi:hypothetical protein
MDAMTFYYKVRAFLNAARARHPEASGGLAVCRRPVGSRVKSSAIRFSVDSIVDYCAEYEGSLFHGAILFCPGNRVLLPVDPDCLDVLEEMNANPQMDELAQADKWKFGA